MSLIKLKMMNVTFRGGVQVVLCNHLVENEFHLILMCVNLKAPSFDLQWVRNEKRNGTERESRKNVFSHRHHHPQTPLESGKFLLYYFCLQSTNRGGALRPNLCLHHNIQSPPTYTLHPALCDLEAVQSRRMTVLSEEDLAGDSVLLYRCPSSRGDEYNYVSIPSIMLY